MERHGLPTGADLALLQALQASGLPFFLTGLVGAAAQGLDVPWLWLDLSLSTVSAYHQVREVARAVGHDSSPVVDGPPRDARIEFDRYVAHEHFARDLARCIDVELGGVRIRVQHAPRILEIFRRSGASRAETEPLEEALRARGQLPIERPRVPGTRLGTLYGAQLREVERVLEEAEYERSDDPRPRTYSVACYDIDARDGMSSADIVVHVDPESPVLDAVYEAMKRKPSAW